MVSMWRLLYIEYSVSLYVTDTDPDLCVCIYMLWGDGQERQREKRRDRAERKLKDCLRRSYRMV